MQLLLAGNDNRRLHIEISFSLALKTITRIRKTFGRFGIKLTTLELNSQMKNLPWMNSLRTVDFN